MKRLFSLILFTTVLTFTPMAAQTDSLAAGATPVDEIEAFSDTTSFDSSAVMPVSPFDDDFDFDDHDDDFFTGSSGFNAIWQKEGEGIMGMFFVLAVLLILFVVSPIVIIGLILWFIYKNRQNRRMRLCRFCM